MAHTEAKPAVTRQHYTV